MTREEFQSYLNIVFVSLKDEAYGKDDKLPAKDKGLLLDVCKIVKYDEHNGKSAFDKAYKNNIEPVIKNWRASMSQNQSSPYLLRQVLYYFCESAYTDGVKEYQQTELINKIMKVEDDKARAFYMEEAAKRGWSSGQLDRQINSFF